MFSLTAYRYSYCTIASCWTFIYRSFTLPVIVFSLSSFYLKCKSFFFISLNSTSYFAYKASIYIINLNYYLLSLDLQSLHVLFLYLYLVRKALVVWLVKLWSCLLNGYAFLLVWFHHFITKLVLFYLLFLFFLFYLFSILINLIGFYYILLLK